MTGNLHQSIPVPHVLRANFTTGWNDLYHCTVCHRSTPLLLWIKVNLLHNKCVMDMPPKTFCLFSVITLCILISLNIPDLPEF